MNELLEPRQEHLEYLDQLRDSGVTNMYGARPYLMGEFGLNKAEAALILGSWMKTYAERHPRDGAA